VRAKCNIHIMTLIHTICCNPSFGFLTKAKTYKGVGQKGSLGVTFHALGSVGDCEGMNLHTPKWIPTLGVEVPMNFKIFKKQLQGSKFIGLKNFLYQQKALEHYMSKMSLHEPFGYLKHKLWPKEGSVVKLSIWFPTIKSQESPWFPFM